MTLPSIKGGRRQLITAEASEAFRASQQELARRIDKIENRTRRVEKGDDILLKVITDGRHAAIDTRLVEAWNDNEPDNKLNKLVAQAFQIWQATGEQRYRQRDGSAFPIPGAAQMIFSDLGTLSAEEKNNEVEIYAFATLGSMDATMWQNNERKARFIAAALSGDRTIRTIDDIGEAANQFALAKAIASGDARLMQKAGLEGEMARLDRQRAGHFDDQLAVRRQISNAEFGSCPSSWCKMRCS